jgi:glutaredoxin
MLLVAIALMVGVTLALQAEIYRWTDSAGKTHFSDRKPADQSAESLRLQVNTAVPPDERAAPADLQVKPVVMYATEWCGYCRKARAYFRKHNIPYTEHDIEKSESALKAFRMLGGRGVPLIVVGDQRMSGFSEGGFRRIYEQ